MLQKIITKINQSKMSLVKRNPVIKTTNTQPAFTCPKSATETPEQSCLHCQPQTHPTSPSPAPTMQLPAGYLQLKLIL